MKADPATSDTSAFGFPAVPNDDLQSSIGAIDAAPSLWASGLASIENTVDDLTSRWHELGAEMLNTRDAFFDAQHTKIQASIDQSESAFRAAVASDAPLSQRLFYNLATFPMTSITAVAGGVMTTLPELATHDPRDTGANLLGALQERAESFSTAYSPEEMLHATLTTMGTVALSSFVAGPMVGPVAPALSPLRGTLLPGSLPAARDDETALVCIPGDDSPGNGRSIPNLNCETHTAAFRGQGWKEEGSGARWADDWGVHGAGHTVQFALQPGQPVTYTVNTLLHSDSSRVSEQDAADAKTLFERALRNWSGKAQFEVWNPTCGTAPQCTLALPVRFEADWVANRSPDATLHLAPAHAGKFGHVQGRSMFMYTNSTPKSYTHEAGYLVLGNPDLYVDEGNKLTTFLAPDGQATRLRISTQSGPVNSVMGFTPLQGPAVIQLPLFDGLAHEFQDLARRATGNAALVVKVGKAPGADTAAFKVVDRSD